MGVRTYMFLFSSAAAASLATSAFAQEAPRIFAGTNGEIEATYQNNCVVYFKANGERREANSRCSRDQVRRADTGVAAYRREQGMDGYAGSEAPPGGYGNEEYGSEAPPGGFGNPAYGSDEVHLTCFGDGKKPQTKTYRTFRWDRREHEFDTDYHTYLSDKAFDSMVQIDIVGRSGHIWLPKDLQPPIHSGGDHGWWEIDDLRMSSVRIVGRYRLNGLNKPHIELDRRTGRLEIRGQRSFKGYCEPS